MDLPFDPPSPITQFQDNTQTAITDLLGMLPRFNITLAPLQDYELSEYVMSPKGDYLSNQYNQSITLIIIVPLLVLLLSILFYLIALCLCGFKSPTRKLLKHNNSASQTNFNAYANEQEALLHKKSRRPTCCSSFIIILIIITSTLSGLAIFFTSTGHAKAVSFNDNSLKIIDHLDLYINELTDMEGYLSEAMKLFDEIIPLEKGGSMAPWLKSTQDTIKDNQLDPIRSSIPAPPVLFVENFDNFLNGKVQTEWMRTVFLCTYGVLQFVTCVIGLVGLLRKSNSLVLTYICMSLISLVVLSILSVYHLNVMVRTADFCNLKGEGMFEMTTNRLKLAYEKEVKNAMEESDYDYGETEDTVIDYSLVTGFADYYYYCNKESSSNTIYDFNTYLTTFKKGDYTNKFKRVRHYAQNQTTLARIQEINKSLSNAYASAELINTNTNCTRTVIDINNSLKHLCKDEMETWTLLLLTVGVLYFCNLIALCSGPKVHNKFRLDSTSRILRERGSSGGQNGNSKKDQRMRHGSSHKTHDLVYQASGSNIVQQRNGGDDSEVNFETPPYRGLTSVQGQHHLRLQQQSSQAPSQPESQQFKNPNYDEHSLAKNYSNKLAQPLLDGHLAANPNYNHYNLPE